MHDLVVAGETRTRCCQCASDRDVAGERGRRRSQRRVQRQPARQRTTRYGNVTIAGPITVSDNKATVSCPSGKLAPGATITCTATYTVTRPTWTTVR